MSLLHKTNLQLLLDLSLNKAVFDGEFGLEKENVRVDRHGRLALTPHPSAFGEKLNNPYIQTDFSESQVEMITPVFTSITETHQFMESIHDIVTLELEEQQELLWPSSNPPMLPQEQDIPIAQMNNAVADEYRHELANKYGRKRQLLSGIHYNFSFTDTFLNQLYKLNQQTDDGQRFELSSSSESFATFKDFKDAVYFKVARNLLKWRWILIYLTGASPIFDKSYMKHCVEKGMSIDHKSYFFPNMSSLRNSTCGYRNQSNFQVSYQSVQQYVQDLQQLIDERELMNAMEFYSPVRMKTADGSDPLQALLNDGVAYLELRFIDLNPLEKIGISEETMHFIHLFLIYMLLKQDEPFGVREQRLADLNHDRMNSEGLDGLLHTTSQEQITLREAALVFMDEITTMVELLAPDKERYISIIANERQKMAQPELVIAELVKDGVHRSDYISYHLAKAEKYAQQSIATGYRFQGYEDLELSTQLLLKAAVKRGIRFELLDRKDNFVRLMKDEQVEYVKQATKTSLDTYSTVLMMENKIVTKIVLAEHGIRVPIGEDYTSLATTKEAYNKYREQQIVIKPKLTNFGLGITILNYNYSEAELNRAFEIAFEHDDTVLLEPFMTGKEYRFLVMGDEVVGILHRVPANVVGDGKLTITQLVQEKNKDPLRGQGYVTPLEQIKLGEAEVTVLASQQKSIDYIPNAGEIIYLRENSNISTGGDSIDYTDDIPDSYKQIAIRAAHAVDATFCGVDMMIDDIGVVANDHNYSIIEINFNPAIHIHCYPYQGKNRKANEKILDLLFDEK
ncbi:bifunctional glutamate--cysteine ligase GshA/glutathione synthetase GshB [Paenibacillus yanchengensis]|uniref:Glutathione biosynthesis bifunctional protein GshAB n=1 Tax=Paenibacillus yanchengensis TaxID=2035833 RepID=A0ABW4YQL5_9BACL